MTDHSRSDVDVFCALFVGGLRDLFGCSVEHMLRPECRISFCSLRVDTDGCGCCSFDGDEDNGRLLSPFYVWIQSLSSKVASQHQGGIALLRKENHPGEEVEATQILTPNLLTFQLVSLHPPQQHHGGGGLTISLGRMPKWMHPDHFGGLEYRFSGPPR